MIKYGEPSQQKQEMELHYTVFWLETKKYFWHELTVMAPGKI